MKKIFIIVFCGALALGVSAQKTVYKTYDQLRKLDKIFVDPDSIAVHDIDSSGFLASQGTFTDQEGMSVAEFLTAPTSTVLLLRLSTTVPNYVLVNSGTIIIYYDYDERAKKFFFAKSLVNTQKVTFPSKKGYRVYTPR